MFPSALNVRVLVVDDQPDTLYVMGGLLKALGCEVKFCADGESCLMEVEGFRPHLLLLDLALPRTSGFAVADLLRQMQLDPQPLIVAVSGYGDKQTVENCRAAGFDSHVLKPASLSQLESLVSEAQKRVK